MVELKIPSYSDREKLVTALANSGYGVKVVEKPHPTRYMSTEHFIQIFDVEDQTSKVNIQTTVVPSDSDASQFAESLRREMEKSGFVKGYGIKF